MARRKIGQTSVGFMMSVFGKIGTGKSNLASQISLLKNKDGSAKKAVLFDVEGKSIEAFNERFLMDRGLQADNILELRTQDVKLIEEICVKYISKGLPIPEIEMRTTKENLIVAGKMTQVEITKEVLTDKPYLDADGKPFIADVVILDSATVYQDLVRYNRAEFAKIRAMQNAKDLSLTGDKLAIHMDNKGGMQIKDYAKTQADIRKMLHSLRATSGIMVVIVDHLKNVKVKDPNGKNEWDTIETAEEVPTANDFKDIEKLSSIIVRTDIGNLVNGAEMKFNVQKDCLGIFGTGTTQNFDVFLKNINEYVNNGTFTQKISFDDAVESGVKAEVIGEYGKDDRVENHLKSEFTEALNKNQAMKEKIIKAMLDKGKTLDDLTEEEMINTIEMIKKSSSKK